MKASSLAFKPVSSITHSLPSTARAMSSSWLDLDMSEQQVALPCCCDYRKIVHLQMCTWKVKACSMRGEKSKHAGSRWFCGIEIPQRVMQPSNQVMRLCNSSCTSMCFVGSPCVGDVGSKPVVLRAPGEWSSLSACNKQKGVVKGIATAFHTVYAKSCASYCIEQQ